MKEQVLRIVILSIAGFLVLLTFGIGVYSDAKEGLRELRETRKNN
jgi:hypothetical protein